MARALQTLAEAPGSLTPGQLARGLGRSAAAASDLIRGLLKAGHLTAEIDPNNRRSFLLHLTPAGKRKWAEVRPRLESAGAALARAFGARRLKMLASEFEDLASLLDHPPK